MKLAAVRHDGHETVGLYLGRDGPQTRLAPVMGLEEFYADTAAGLERARAVGSDRPSIAGPAVPFVPVGSRVFCVGLNYKNHAAEGGHDSTPPHPDIFGRWRNTLITSGESLSVPPSEEGLDWEGELAVVIGEPTLDASPEQAARNFLGFTCFNDLSARRYQLATAQNTLGKNADRSGPIGPVLVTADEVPDPLNLRLVTKVNGETMQDAMTSEMIFTPDCVASYISRVTELRPGDVISTGTPAGVGFRREPPRLLSAGDEVAVEIEGIGLLETWIA